MTPSRMPSSVVRGILSMLAAVASFSVMDATMKHLAEVYPAMQVTFLRGAASLPFLLAGTALFGRWADLLPRRWSLHLLRGLLGVGTLWLFVHALRVLSLADVYTIFMSAPLWITALSVPLLGERVGWRRWLAVLAGLAGVIMVLNPSGTGIATLGGLAALGAALAYALSAVTIRILARSDTGAATVMWTLLLVTLLSGAAAVGDWQAVQWPQHWPWILGLGLSGALGQYLITQAFRRAPPPLIAPLEYTALAWGLLLDWLLWAVAPSAHMLGGAAIIVASGLYVLHRARLTAGAPS